MGRGSVRLLLGLFGAAALALAGCGDANLFEGAADESGDRARLEKGLEALDDGDWDGAIAVFGAMDTSDPEVRKYLSSAYVGKAGFDALALVEDIADAQDAGAADSVVYDSVTSIFDDDGDGRIDADELADKRELLRQALAVFGLSLPAGRRAARLDTGGLTDDEVFQAGLYAALHAVLGVVSQLEDPEAPGRLLLTLDGLREHPEVIGSGDGTGDGVSVPAGFDDDLGVVQDAVEVLSPGLTVGSFQADGNDISDDLNDFLTEIGFLPDGSVSTAELRTYLLGLLD